MRKLFIAATLAAAAVTSVGFHAGAQNAAPKVEAGNYKLDKRHAKIVWNVNHMGFSIYYGEFTNFDATLTLDPAKPDASKLNVTIDVKSVSTNDADLDKHLNAADFFDTANHPTATFVSTSVQPTGATTAKVTGDFTLRGVTKPLTLDVTLLGAGPHPMSKAPVAGFSATGTIKRSDFGVKYGVPMVGDDVTLHISGEFNKA